MSALIAASLVATQPYAAEGTAPDTGFFVVTMTPVEIVGEAAAKGVADILPPDGKIEWQVFVPPDYSAENPPGVMVFVSSTGWGGPPRDWGEMLAGRNLIWIGATGAGDSAPIAERMLKAMLAPAVIQKTYAVDVERCYVAGLSGGGMTAARVATTRPEQFKGGIYMSGAVFWDANVPPKLDQIKQNRYVFLIGSNDSELLSTRRMYKKYKDAGVTNSLLLRIPNIHLQHWLGVFLPPTGYFEKAIDYLDSDSSNVEGEQ